LTQKHMRKRLLLIAVFLSTMCGAVMAQTISGKVTEGNDGSPLAGVSVVVKGATTGTTTDANGQYSLVVPDKTSILVVSFIGFETTEIAVGDRTTIDVALKPSMTELAEVMVTALGIPREAKTLVYATQAVKPQELVEVRDANNVINSFQGKVAGAFITQGSGGP